MSFSPKASQKAGTQAPTRLRSRRAGAGKADKGERRCLVHGASARGGLIRFVVTPNGDLVADLTEKLPGRGAWVSSVPADIKSAIDKKLFHKPFGTAVKAAPDFVERLAEDLRVRCLNWLGLAKRTGALAIGSEQVEVLIKTGKAAAVFVALDASARQASNTRQGGQDVPCFAFLTRDEMATALGRDVAVYAALHTGPMSEKILNDFTRAAAFAVQKPTTT